MNPFVELFSAAGVASHLWQSTVAGLLVLGLLGAARRLSADTRRKLAWLALAKFCVPSAALAPVARWATALFRPDSGSALPLSIPFIQAGPDWAVSVDAESALVHRPGEWIAGLWTLGTIAILATWIVRGASLRRRLLESGAPLSWPLQRAVASAANRLGLRSSPRCLAVAPGYGPGVLGVFSPIVVLPQGIEDRLTADELEPVLLHELVHLRRRDPWVNFLQVLVVSVFWFHPVVWLLHRRLRFESEKSCDARVLAITGNPESYAAGILNTVRFTLGLSQLGIVGVGSQPLASRITAILARNRGRERPLLRFAAFGAGLAALAASGYAGSITLERADTGLVPDPIASGRDASASPIAAARLPAAPRPPGPAGAGVPGSSTVPMGRPASIRSAALPIFAAGAEAESNDPPKTTAAHSLPANATRTAAPNLATPAVHPAAPARPAPDSEGASIASQSKNPDFVYNGVTVYDRSSVYPKPRLIGSQGSLFIRSDRNIHVNVALVLHVILDDRGRARTVRVVNARVIQSPEDKERVTAQWTREMETKVAEKAIRWKFLPGLKNGIPVATHLWIPAYLTVAPLPDPLASPAFSLTKS